MSLQQRLIDLTNAVGADIKSLRGRVSTLENASGGTASLTHQEAQLDSDITLVFNQTSTLVTMTLATGTWLVSSQALLGYGGTGTGADLILNMGTAAGSVTGPRSTSGRSASANSPVQMVLPGTIVTVTSAGTIVLQATSNAGTGVIKTQSYGSSYYGATAMSAVKIA